MLQDKCPNTNQNYGERLKHRGKKSLFAVVFVVGGRGRGAGRAEWGRAETKRILIRAYR